MRGRLERALQRHPAVMERLRRLLVENQTFADVMWVVRGRQVAVLDYPVRQRPRYVQGAAPHPGLHALISRNDEAYADLLDRGRKYHEALAAIPVRSPEVTSGPTWINGWLPPMDMVVNYTLLAEERPARYVEIGSGESTKLARRAITDGGLRTELTSIDPHPRAEVDPLCDRVVRTTLEDSDLSIFDEVGAGDVVFFDGSHRSFMNSDVTVFFLEVLPNLPRGVTVGLHDIELPWDYPASWAQRFYNEQYLLAVHLLTRDDPASIVLPVRYVADTPALAEITRDLWRDPRLAELPRPVGGGFWFRT
ncbi:class I SAM-dependent methyltransferase [Actinomycetospora lemnae]|uniref:Class I SAM-dependent methyltransferase n=1 Tax=Actinomycetospora lemnae TaxID=3019891 RepID=A0ABT5SUK8_9PSEU|nr:class I SAM-dependent methyltransferase [Actinomycetospora sp. DW7H6]MDD7966366.1 class I SAM-dependent methyltransferase [Actinomycetospora sp. DW7H6]